METPQYLSLCECAIKIVENAIPYHEKGESEIVGKARKYLHAGDARRAAQRLIAEDAGSFAAGEAFARELDAFNSRYGTKTD